MKHHSESVNLHYGNLDLSKRIKNALVDAGINLETITLDDIQSFDEFHIGGKEQTHNLAKLIKEPAGKSLLDIGCGIGGPSRTLFLDYGCKVTGIDLTNEFIDAANMLNDLTRLRSGVKFIHGSALEIPSEDDFFDIVWMQHVGMNIMDKHKLFSEIKRVLKNNGTYAFYEIIKGDDQEIHFPVFWASEPNMSFLINEDELKSNLDALGFKQLNWEETTSSAIKWFSNMIEKSKHEGPNRLGLGLIVEKDPGLKAENVYKNLSEGKIRVIRSSFRISK